MTRRLRLVAVAAVAATLPAGVAAAATDPTALVQTVQSKPVKLKSGKVRSVVGQAAITQGGRVVIRLAGPNAAGVQGETVLAQTSRKIADAVSNPRKAKLTIEWKANGTGTVAVLGPRNATEPDAIAYTVRWKAGSKPSVRIVHVGT